MKKIIAIVLCIVLVAAVFASCTQAPKAQEEGTQTEEAAVSVAGGWTVPENNGADKALDASRQEVFDKATEGLTGVGYTPVAYLGSQVVAGTNHMILCMGTTVTAEPEAGYYVMTIYEDLEGNCEVTNIADFSLADIQERETSDGTETGLEGGWTVVSDFPEASFDDETQKVFDEASNLCGAGYRPMALLGTKVVNGTSYAFLCHQTLVTAEPIDNICVLFATCDSSGKVTCDNIVTLNLAEYTA